MTETPCFVLASRLIPDQDGGFARAVMRRAYDLRREGFDVTVLTVDPAPAADHDAHRREWVRRGELHEVRGMRNLFDDARADASWLRAAASGTTEAADVEYNHVSTTDGTRVLSLPVITGDVRWHTSDAPVIVYDEAGQPVGSVPGFGGLYRAWLSHVVPDSGVVIIEARQLGDLLAEWESLARLIHTIHTNHLGEPYQPDSPVNALWHGWFAVADQFDAVVWPTAAQQRDVQARFGAGRADVVVPNGVDIDPAASGAPASRRAVMVNRLAPGKRVDHAIRAWQQVVQVEPDATLDIYGDGPERQRLADLIDSLELGGAVRLRGVVADVSECYDNAAFMLLTTAYEGQGLVVGEALGTATPVISYDVAYGPRDLLQHGGGILVPSGDEHALVEAILSVLRDAELHRRLIAEAPAAAAAIERGAVSRRWADLVRSVASRPARRAGR